MRAVVYRKYGPPEVLRPEDVPTPEPRRQEVLIRVHAVTVNTGDCELRRGQMPNLIWFLVRLYFGPFRPRKKILGAYLAGEVEAVGNDVEDFQPGDSVFAATGARFSGYAEYVCLSSRSAIARKPISMSYEEAATVPLGGLNALHYLRKGNLQKGQSLLINGAGGSFGTFAVQIAKNLGAEVTAVDCGEKLDMLREIGADHVIDYTQEDYTENGQTYDVILNMVVQSPYSRALRSVKKGGRYVLANPNGVTQMLRAVWTSAFSKKKVVFAFANETAEELLRLEELVEEGKLRAVIDRTYPLEQAAEAHRYVESGAKRGNVVLLVNPGRARGGGS